MSNKHVGLDWHVSKSNCVKTQETGTNYTCAKLWLSLSVPPEHAAGRARVSAKLN